MVSPQPNASDQGRGASDVSTPIGRGIAFEEPSAGPLAQQVRPVSPSSVSWGAVIAGTLLTLAILALSGVLAYACGVPAYTPQPNGHMGVYGWGAGIWAVVSSILAFLAGGCFTGYLSRGPDRYRLLQGLVTWPLGIALVLLFGMAVPENVTPLSLVHANLQAMLWGVGPAETGPATWGLQTGAAWGSFVALLLGLLAAFVGGFLGAGGPAGLRQEIAAQPRAAEPMPTQ